MLIILATIIFFSTKDLNKPYDKVIMAEGIGYYVYLPATFIYHDYTFNFFNDLSAKYYRPNFNPPTKNFINEFNGLKVNKFYPGLSLLLTPFFLLALFIAHVAHLPADGFSPIFQYSVGVSGLFYTWLGLKFLKKTLAHFKLSELAQTITLTAVFFSTNLLYYVVCFPAQSHCYLFFLISSFIFFSIFFFNDSYNNKEMYLAGMVLTAALILTVRPQDIIIVLLLPLFGLSLSKLRNLRHSIFSLKTGLSVLLGLIIIGRVIFYWYVQTGKIFINPYQGENYHFNRPHFFDVLISYRKGWITYCPVIFWGMAGTAFMKNNFQKIYLTSFWVVLVYITSCWWCWTFGSATFGQRVFVDFYGLLGISMGFFIDWFVTRRKIIFPVIGLALFVSLCLLQTYQFKNGIIPGEFASKETYWKNFLTMHPISQYPVPREIITHHSETNLSNKTFSGNQTTFICGDSPFSKEIKTGIPTFMFSGDYWNVKLSARMKSSSNNRSKRLLVIDFLKNGKSISWNGFDIDSFFRNDQWTDYECGLNLPENVHSSDSVHCYFWQPEGSKDTTYFSSVKLEFNEIDHSYLLKPR